MLVHVRAMCTIAVPLQLCTNHVLTGTGHFAQVAIAVMICLSVLPLLRQAAGVLLLQPQAGQRAAFDGCLSRVRCLEGVAEISSTSFIQVRFQPKHGLRAGKPIE